MREAFEPFGRIRRVRIVVDQKTGKPRGYAFIEYESEYDFNRKPALSFLTLILIVALERANNRRIDGRRVVVDYERGRTKKEWVPRRLGGGKGDKRRDRDTERLVRDLKKNEHALRSRSRSRDQETSAVKKETPASVMNG